MTTQSTYTEDNVRSLERLESVRHRPTQYLPDTEAGGLTHQAKEIIDNSIDELAQLMGDMLLTGVLNITLCRDFTRGTFQLIIRDNGRGIPLKSLLNVLTKLNTSGKFDAMAYGTSAGLFGLGAKVAAGLSRVFRGLTYRPDGIGSLLVQQGTHSMTPDYAPSNGTTGVTIAYEPDSMIFTGIPEYADTGYISLLDMLKKYVFFTPYPIEFRILDEPVPEKFWTASITEATAIVAQVEEKATLIWSAKTQNRDEWIRHYWHVTRPFAWKYEFYKTTPITTPLRDYHIILYYVKYEQKGDVFGMVNNIPIDHTPSNHLSVAAEQIMAALAPKIADAAVRRYFIESYRLPVFMAVDVKFTGAEPAGTTKHAFISAPFREFYRAELQAHLTHSGGAKAMSDLFELIEDEITSRYMQSLSSLGKTKAPMNRLFLELNRPDKFSQCSTKNRKEAELFLVEGKSAGGSAGHDTETQAIYELSGKPKNVIRTGIDHRGRVAEILKNEIYQDIFRIINYDPLKPNMNNLNFGRCFFMADGDAHGGHIVSILVGTFQVAAPELVASGFFGVVAPPYYEVWAGKRKTTSTYVRDQEDLVQWNAINIYDKHLFIDIVYTEPNGSAAKARLARDQLVLLAIKINEVGQLIENLASEFSLPGLLIEALTRATYYLSPETMDTDQVCDILGAHRVEYDASIHTLIVSLGREDYVIPLHHVQDRICTQVSIILQRLQWRNWNLYITSKTKPEYDSVPMSIFQLYEVFKHMNSLVTVKVLKGIGSMASDESAMVCMNPRNRRVFDITSPGDVDVIFDLLGSDSKHRKDLLSAPPLVDLRRGMI